MAKQYIGSQEHFEDEINAYYDQKEEMKREIQKQYEKEMMEEMERDYYEQQPNDLCHRCGGVMKFTGIAKSSLPPQYEYRCEKCKHVQYSIN